MTRTTRREADRLRAEIADGMIEYREERARERRVRVCGTVSTDRGGLEAYYEELARAERERRCGTVARDLPIGWWQSLLPVLPKHAVCLFTGIRPQPLVH